MVSPDNIHGKAPVSGVEQSAVILDDTDVAMVLPGASDRLFPAFSNYPLGVESFPVYKVQITQVIVWFFRVRSVLDCLWGKGFHHIGGDASEFRADHPACVDQFWRQLGSHINDQRQFFWESPVVLSARAESHSDHVGVRVKVILCILKKLA